MKKVEKPSELPPSQMVLFKWGCSGQSYIVEEPTDTVAKKMLNMKRPAR